MFTVKENVLCFTYINLSRGGVAVHTRGTYYVYTEIKCYYLFTKGEDLKYESIRHQ